MAQKSFEFAFDKSEKFELPRILFSVVSRCDIIFSPNSLATSAIFLKNGKLHRKGERNREGIKTFSISLVPWSQPPHSKGSCGRVQFGSDTLAYWRLNSSSGPTLFLLDFSWGQLIHTKAQLNGKPTLNEHKFL